LAQQLQAADSPGGVLFETFHRRKDGSTFPVEVSARSLEIGGKLYRQSFVRDITTRRQAEDAIRESEVRFRTVVESAPDGIFIQTGGRFAWLNREAMRIFGIAGMEAARGQPVAERFHPDSRELARARIRLVNEERRSVGAGELAVLQPDGSRVDVETSAVPFTYEGEDGALVYVRDITDRKHALEELRRSEHRFRTLVEGVPNIAVQGYDRERRVVFWNAASEALYGFTPEEAAGRKLEDLIIPPEMREAVVAATTRWVTDGVPIPASELVLRRKDGSPVTVFSSHAMSVNQRGDPEMYCIDVDLTALKRAEAESVEWKHRYEAAILASGQLLHDWNPKTGEMSILGDTERMLGYRTDEMAGGLPRWREQIHPDDREAFDRGIAHAIENRAPFHQRYRVARKDGIWLTMQDDGYFLLDASGAISRMVCFVVDVTERSRVQSRIEEQLDELRRWHAAMLGRETRILELKREVNGLLAAAGQSPRYGVTGRDGAKATA
ncbi:MAG TPA: PAS domain S-box protein, partial [Usitatibacteraceae bacterium]|nr:PAS domain S-box protein [Usitatibacteraceae bacterium]